MPQISEHLLITTYDGVAGGHILADHAGAVHYLCSASRDENNRIRHFWWVYELDDPQAPAVDCPDCLELFSNRGD